MGASPPLPAFDGPAEPEHGVDGRRQRAPVKARSARVAVVAVMVPMTCMRLTIKALRIFVFLVLVSGVVVIAAARNAHGARFGTAPTKETHRCLLAL